MHPDVNGNTIYNSQDMEAPKVSIDRWMDKEDVARVRAHTHTHTVQYHSAIKNEIMSFAATLINLEVIIITEDKDNSI